MRSQVTYFCESEFWDPKLTWYTETPQLTSCFQSTVLVYTPALTLVVSGLWDLHTCYHSKSRTLPWTGMQSSDWSILSHTVKILGFSQKKWYKGFYAKNVVPYICEDDI